MSFFLALSDYTVKVTAVLALAYLATFSLRRSSAAVRHLIWTAAFASILLLPIAQKVVPGFPVIVIRQAPAIAPPAATWVDPGPTVTDDAIASLEPLSAKSELNRLGLIHTTIPSTKEPRQTGRLGIQLFERAGLPLWVCGVAGYLFYAALGLLILLRLRSRSRDFSNEYANTFPTLGSKAGVVRRWKLRVSRGGYPPVSMTWGVAVPTILLPRDSITWTPEQFEAVILHELAHVRRRDYLTSLIAVAACSLNWFNPLVWFAARSMRAEAETAADDLVIEAGVSPSTYASILLDIASAVACRRASLPYAGVTIMKSSKIESRVRKLLLSSTHRRGATTRQIIGTLTVSAIALIGLSLVRPAIAQSGGAKATISGSQSVDATKVAGSKSASSQAVAVQVATHAKTRHRKHSKQSIVISRRAAARARSRVVQEYEGREQMIRERNRALEDVRARLRELQSEAAKGAKSGQATSAQSDAARADIERSHARLAQVRAEVDKLSQLERATADRESVQARERGLLDIEQEIARAEGRKTLDQAGRAREVGESDQTERLRLRYAELAAAQAQLAKQMADIERRLRELERGKKPGKQERIDGSSGVPVLKDIPLIGKMFRMTPQKSQKSRLEMLRNEVQSAQASVDSSKANLLRMKELFKNGSVSGLEVTAAEAQLAQANANLESAKKQLDMAQAKVQWLPAAANQQLSIDYRLAQSYSLELQPLKPTRSDYRIQLDHKLLPIKYRVDFKYTLLRLKYKLQPYYPKKEIVPPSLGA